MKLNVKAFALSSGITCGLIVCLTTFFFLVMGYEGKTLVKLSKIYFGYSVTWYGALAGLVYGFIDGLICGGFFAWLYNRFIIEESIKKA